MFYNLINGLFSQEDSREEDTSFKNSIGNEQENEEGDIKIARRKFQKAGYYTSDLTSGILDNSLINTTKAFQINQGLKEDGIIKPKGETETALNRTLDRMSGKSPDIKGKNGGYFSGIPSPLTLENSVGAQGDNTTQDVQKLENVLAGLGMIKQGRADQAKGQIYQEIIDAVKVFQKENGLRVDGVLKPQGETETALNTELGKIFFVADKGEKENPSHDEVFEQFRKKLTPREGGIADRSTSEDLGGLTNKGISQKFYDVYKKKYPDKTLPNKTTELTDNQIDHIYRKIFFESPQIGKLNDIAGYHKAGSNLVEHVFDANIMSDTLVVGRWLQESIDEVMGTNLKTLKNGQESYDGIMGSKTRHSLKLAVEADKVKEISKLFYKKRILYLRNLSNYDSNPGWEYRAKNLEDK